MNKDELINELNDFLDLNKKRLMSAQFNNLLKWELLSELADKILKIHENECTYKKVITRGEI